MIPMDDRDGFIWFDGKLVPWREAKIHVLTHGLHYASAVFEGERAYGGHIFKSTEHSERLKAPAENRRTAAFTPPATRSPGRGRSTTVGKVAGQRGRSLWVSRGGVDQPARGQSN